MKFYNLNKIDVKSKEFVKWKQKADDLNTKLRSLITHEERVNFLKKITTGNTLEISSLTHSVNYVGTVIVA